MNITAPRDFSQEEIAAINEKAMALLQECRVIPFPDAHIARHLPRPFPIRRIDEAEFADALTTPAKLMALLGRVSEGLQTIQELVVTARERAALEEEEPIETPAPASDDVPAAETKAPQPAPTAPKPAPKSTPVKARQAHPGSRAPAEQDVILEFRRAVEAAGIPIKDDIIANTPKIQRAYVSGDRKGSKNCWYILKIGDGVPSGAFGCHKRYGGKKFTWSMKGAKPLTREERREVTAKAKADAERRAAQERELQEKAAERAVEIWGSASEAPADHPYLARKGVKPHGLRVGTWTKEWTDQETGEVHRKTVKGALILPIRGPESRAVVSLQAIFPSSKNTLGRDKDFLTDGRKRGCYFVIGKPVEIDGRMLFVICEGYATGASIHEATGACVIVAFDAGNLREVAKNVADATPEGARIVIAGDNDLWTEKPVRNPGLRAPARRPRP